MSFPRSLLNWSVHEKQLEQTVESFLLSNAVTRGRASVNIAWPSSIYFDANRPFPASAMDDFPILAFIYMLPMTIGERQGAYHPASRVWLICHARIPLAGISERQCQESDVQRRSHMRHDGNHAIGIGRLAKYNLFFSISSISDTQISTQDGLTKRDAQ